MIPSFVGCVTNDMNVVERVLGTFDADDLAELKQGVSQLPNPPVEGHFRIYQQEDFQRPFNLSIPEIQNLVFQYMQERSYVKVGNEIPPEMRSNSAAYVPVEALTGTWAIVELMKGAADGKNGVSFYRAWNLLPVSRWSSRPNRLPRHCRRFVIQLGRRSYASFWGTSLL